MNALTRKLENFAPLSPDDRRLLCEVTATARHVPADTDIIGEDERPDAVHLILDGFACRYKLTEDGQRQIMAFLVPGDFCDLHVFILKEMDHSIGTLSPCRVVDIPRPRILELLERPAIARALWWATLVDEAVLREWLVNLGRRNAAERLGHLFCEMLLRLRSVGLVRNNQYELPLTQAELADALGLSTVHLNRSMQQLREAGLISFRSSHLEVLDVDSLFSFTGFNANYLHLEERGEAEAGAS